MKRLNNLSLRQKLFAVILLVLLANFVLLVLLGSTLFQAFYENNKLRELKRTANKISSVYSELGGSSELLYEQLSGIENRNNEAVIFQLGDDDRPTEIIYHSRLRVIDMAKLQASQSSQAVEFPSWQNADPAAGTTPVEGGIPVADDTPNTDSKTGEGAPPANENNDRTTHQSYRVQVVPALSPLPSSEQVDRLPALAQGELITNVESGFGGNHISIAMRLDDETFLVIDTPRAYITETAELAVRYSAFVSIGVLLVGAAAIYWLSGRFTRPISEMERVAQQIARLDFSASCPVLGNDELGALGASINHMSSELQRSIGVLEDDLKRQQETDRMRRRFISDVSHDFKTPLTLIISYAEAIRDGREPEHTAEYCDIITDEGNRLSQLVGRLLRLSRLESGMDTPQPTPFSLNQLLDDTVRTMRLPARQKQLEFTQNTCGEVIVNADYQMLCLVVQNLVENAVKYTRPGGKITLTTRLIPEGLCEVAIHNEGDPLSKEALERIFISFYRADDARERDGDSYGLGLAIVQTILLLHNSRCIAENTDDGVCFRFCLPTVSLDDN